MKGFESKKRVNAEEFIEILNRFNDVMVFDNIYKTNQFQMLFSIFMEVNNYRNSICFVSTLIIDETEDKFI